MTQALSSSSRYGYDAMSSYDSLVQSILYLHIQYLQCTRGEYVRSSISCPMLGISNRNYESATDPRGRGKHENAVSEILVARLYSTPKVTVIALNLLCKHSSNRRLRPPRARPIWNSRPSRLWFSFRLSLTPVGTHHVVAVVSFSVAVLTSFRPAASVVF